MEDSGQRRRRIRGLDVGPALLENGAQVSESTTRSSSAATGCGRAASPGYSSWSRATSTDPEGVGQGPRREDAVVTGRHRRLPGVQEGAQVAQATKVEADPDPPQPPKPDPEFVFAGRLASTGRIPITSCTRNSPIGRSPSPARPGSGEAYGRSTPAQPGLSIRARSRRQQPDGLDLMPTRLHLPGRQDASGCCRRSGSRIR